MLFSLHGGERPGLGVEVDVRLIDAHTQDFAAAAMLTALLPYAQGLLTLSVSVDGKLVAKAVASKRPLNEELKGMPGVISTQCDYLGGKCRVEIDPARVKKEDVAVQMNRLGYQAFLKSEGPLH